MRGPETTESFQSVSRFDFDIPSTAASPATKHGGRRILSTDRDSGVSMIGYYAVSVPLPDANNETAMSAVGQKQTSDWSAPLGLDSFMRRF